jgi:arylsulfatase A-like enzyme
MSLRVTPLLAGIYLVLISAIATAGKPNIVFVLCDDLGYGDVHSLNPERGKIPTPAVDRLAREGMIFTDAHSGSSVCTPTRYGLLTGRYSWRTTLQSGVVQGFAPCLIAPDRPTVASFLKRQGYQTAIIGKWHLNFLYRDSVTEETLTRQRKGELAPVGSRIPDGPLTRGFDYFHVFHHARDMKAVIENDTVIVHEDEIKMLPRLTRKAVDYIDERAKSMDGQPFFLYVSYGSPLLGTPLPVGSAEDSVSFLPAMKGEPLVSTRAGVIHHSISGHFGYRQGKWKLLLARGSGGWTAPTEDQVPAGTPAAQLFDLEADPGETTNLYASHPKVASRLLGLLENDVARGRSTAGPAARNDSSGVRLWKSEPRQTRAGVTPAKEGKQ